MTDAALINWIFSCCFVYPIKQLSFYLTRFCWVNPWTPNRLLTWELTIKVWFLQHGFECSPSKRYKMAYTRGVQAVPERDLFKIWWGMQICTSTQKLSGWKWTCYCLLWFPQGTMLKGELQISSSANASKNTARNKWQEQSYSAENSCCHACPADAVYVPGYTAAANAHISCRSSIRNKYSF